MRNNPFFFNSCRAHDFFFFFKLIDDTIKSFVLCRCYIKYGVLFCTVIYVYIASCDWTTVLGRNLLKHIFLIVLILLSFSALYFVLFVLGTSRTKVSKCYFSVFCITFFATVKLPFFLCFSYHIVLYVSLKHLSVFPGNLLDKRFCLALLACLP